MIIHFLSLSYIQINIGILYNEKTLLIDIKLLPYRITTVTEIFQIQHTHDTRGDVSVYTQTLLSTYTSILAVKTAGLGMRTVTLIASPIGRGENSCERY